LNAGFYWIGSYWQDPEEPLSVKVLYQEDLEPCVLLLIKYVSEGTLSEFLVKEFKGIGLFAFPLGSTLWHGILTRFLGSWGYVIASLGIAWIYFVLVKKLLEYAQLSSQVALYTAFALSVGTHKFLWKIEKQFPMFWSARIPRPTVTELYLVACLIFLVLLVRSQGKKSFLPWFGLGLSASFLLQGEIYLIFPITFSSIVMVFWMWFVQTEKRIFILKVLVSILTACFFSLFFFYSLLMADPEPARRLGVIPLSLSQMPSLFFFYELHEKFPLFFYLVFVFLLTLGIHFLLKILPLDPSEKEAFSWLSKGGLVLSLFSYLAPWICVLFLKKGVELYHFEYALRHVLSYVLLLDFFYLIRLGSDFVKRKDTKIASFFEREKVEKGLCILICILSFFKMFKNAEFALNHFEEKTMFLGKKEYPSPSYYRKAFVDLSKVLQREEFHSKVLASTDIQVFSWWGALGKGFLFNPDPFVSSVPDRLIEERLALLGQIFQWEESQYIQFLADRYTLMFFLGHYKYQAVKSYTFSSLDQYPQEVQNFIQGTVLKFSEAYQIFLPYDEQERLKKEYQKASRWDPLQAELDVIVLTKNTMFNPIPRQDIFGLYYQNEYFQVYTKKDLFIKK
jgi:hypothetical protein